jgi:hypothetical protein
MFKRNILTLSMVMISFNAFAGTIGAHNSLTNAGAIMANTGRTASESSTYSYQLNQANLDYTNCLSSTDSSSDWSDDGWFFGWWNYSPCQAKNDVYNALLNQAIKTPTELEQTTNVGQNVATLVQQNSANQLQDKQVLTKTENSTAFTVGGLVKGITSSALISKRSENPNSILTTVNQPTSLANIKERGVGTKVADSKLSKETLVNRAIYITNFANQSIGQGVVNGGTQINNGGILNLITDNNVSSSLNVLPTFVLPTLTNNINSSTINETTNNNGSSGSGLSQITCPSGQVVFSIANCDSLTSSNGYIEQTFKGISIDYKDPELNAPLTLLTGVPIFK